VLEKQKEIDKIKLPVNPFEDLKTYLK